MKQSYKDFKNSTVRAGQAKEARVRNSWGVYDAYKYIRKQNWYDIGRPVKEHEFYSIVRGVNKLLAKEIASGHEITFPSRMGSLELRKYEAGVSIVGDKLRVNYPIDWEKTIRLWFEDNEAKKNKTLLRNEEKFIYHIRYNKYDANYENKIFYEFTVNRLIKKQLKENIQKGEIETLW